MVDKSPKEPLTDDQTQAPGPSKSGLAILGVILIVCVVVAYFLSTLAISRGPSVEEIVPPPVNLTSNEGTGNKPVSSDQTSEIPPRSGIEAMTLQLRGMNTVGTAINAYKDSNGMWPSSLEFFIEDTGFELADNPFIRGTKMEPVTIGQFKAGGISYMRYQSIPGGAIDGFILVGYADDENNGRSIEFPNDLVAPGRFEPSINVPLTGVNAAILENGELVDLSEY